MPVVRADTPERYDDALDVRMAVFVEEQGVPESVEVDDHEDEATHFVAYDADTPVATARLREYEPGVGKVERVAVLESRRGEGWGDRVMDALESAASESYDELYLHAQQAAAGFYERRDYEREGDSFEEAGIPHVAMRKSLN
ncbi:GNAT family N-acetyltransferase [Halobacterium zhouii]|uniref:GNAT family N-acetyltransferase n=1 Tax=Halobacterium zhouii TaxID=2902624 RepID=UPI001E4ABB33|nr:GNAT family N-acetyltransferase [Halobacterium zhouii]